jgi:signal transduction histidine kinase/ActR/RegA family two-component response regulator
VRAIKLFWTELTAARRTRESVRGKLMRVVSLTTVIALLVAGAALLWHDLTVYRQSWTSDLTTEANILSISMAPALAFDDQAAAERDLVALEARPQVLLAALYLPNGELYADYVRSGAAPPPPQLPSAITGMRISGERVELTQRIIRNGEWLGTISLRARYDITGRVLTYLGILAVVIAISLLAALILSTAMQRIITAPLDAMSDVARQIVHQRDYSLRVQKTTDDEIGLVVEAFNSMLNEVHSRTQALEQSNAALLTEGSRLKQTQDALREADRRKDEFLATLAHELRNPLAPIRNAARLLDIPSADDRERQWSRDVIARQVDRMALLLDDLLDVSRITRGRMQLRKEPVELAVLVASAVETARPLIDSKQHVVDIVLPSEPIELEVDSLRLSQALSNLLTNAAKYTDAAGHIRLAVSLQDSDVTFSVSDTGIGLNQEALPKLFEMFSQIESPVDRAEGGLGIGLALVKGLVALHGGTVEAASDGSGRGSTFTIRLPRSVVVSKQSRPSAVPVTHQKHSDPRCKVLVADDNADAAQSLAMILKMAGYDVRVALSGQEALTIANREQPDAMFLDIGMFDMSGYEVAASVRKESWGQRVLLVAVTGWGQPDDQQRSKAAGFDHHLTKPVDLGYVEQLLAAFSKQLESGDNTQADSNPQSGRG